MRRIDPDTEFLLDLQRDTFPYFEKETNPENGLMRDATLPESPASIAVVGLGLTADIIAVERGLMSRDLAAERALATVRFFLDSPQGPEPNATGYHGFYYHFLEMRTGQRVGDCELSSIDTALLMAGVLASALYFDRANVTERDLRARAEALYARVEWDWMLNDSAALSNGWKPESGFLPYSWRGFSEGSLLYLLALGSPTHPISPACWLDWTATYVWREVYDLEYLYAGPLFIYQLPHCWIDFRIIQDAYMGRQGIDYFENSRRATYAQQRYAIENPHGFAGYGAECWGLTASDGPGPASRTVDGRKINFFGYNARGIPDGPDDGTIAPSAVAASLPFAPEIVLPALYRFKELALDRDAPYGFGAAFNFTYAGTRSDRPAWIANHVYGLNQGPTVIMIENYLTGFVWRLMRSCPSLQVGLRRAGFQGGWLL